MEQTTTNHRVVIKLNIAYFQYLIFPY